MSVDKAALNNLLVELARALGQMPADQIEKVANGEFRVEIRCVEPSDKTAINKILLRRVSEEELSDVKEKLAAARSRDEGYKIVEEALPEKERLFAFAKSLDLPVQRRDNTNKMRDKIVTCTVGRRLGGEAIRGGYPS